MTKLRLVLHNYCYSTVIVTGQLTIYAQKGCLFIKAAVFNSIFVLFSDIVTVLLEEPDAPVLVEVTR